MCNAKLVALLFLCSIISCINSIAWDMLASELLLLQVPNWMQRRLHGVTAAGVHGVAAAGVIHAVADAGVHGVVAARVVHAVAAAGVHGHGVVCFHRGRGGGQHGRGGGHPCQPSGAVRAGRRRRNQAATGGGGVLSAKGTHLHPYPSDPNLVA